MVGATLNSSPIPTLLPLLLYHAYSTSDSLLEAVIITLSPNKTDLQPCAKTSIYALLSYTAV